MAATARLAVWRSGSRKTSAATVEWRHQARSAKRRRLERWMSCGEFPVVVEAHRPGWWRVRK
jgi:hypothetical protein